MAVRRDQKPVCVKIKAVARLAGCFDSWSIGPPLQGCRAKEASYHNQRRPLVRCCHWRFTACSSLWQQHAAYVEHAGRLTGRPGLLICTKSQREPARWCWLSVRWRKEEWPVYGAPTLLSAEL